ncbi:hypothetical protein L873DRAFT_1811413 [Choiromyces venosus 120613-1]|uniref:Uncharacterized protein n=1 Tax=Choiromyces venosus 120613-1 TaxID=1336337 RepID=A0A3N4JHZ7_9PEZI|nr:hypothetical protein L873DRAFT_1811413 [Choiromyces venosus 120613-1]
MAGLAAWDHYAAPIRGLAFGYFLAAMGTLFSASPDRTQTHYYPRSSSHRSFHIAPRIHLLDLLVPPVPCPPVSYHW